MQLTLEVRSYCDQPANDSKKCAFTTFPVIVGRSASCDYVLDDLNKYISSNHATFLLENGHVLMQDMSANGTYVNQSGESVGKGNVVAIANNDLITIGDYSLVVTLSGSDTNSDPFAIDSRHSVHSQPTKINDYQPFGGSEEDWTPLSAVNQDRDDDPFATLYGNSPNSLSPPHNNDDDWANIGAGNRQANPRIAPSRRQPPKPQPQNPPAAVHAAHSVDMALLVKALGVDPQLLTSVPDSDVLEQTGKMLHAAIDGMMVLLQSRNELKNAMRSDVTQLARTGNNPLKFSYSASDALAKLLAETGTGYLPADEAIAETVNDLKMHQVATLEAMKAAVKAIMQEFDPNRLARTLEKDRPLAANIPLKREAELWNLFCDQYGHIRDEAMNDFRELFGREFRKAFDSRMRQQGREPDFQ